MLPAFVFKLVILSPVGEEYSAGAVAGTPHKKASVNGGFYL